MASTGHGYLLLAQFRWPLLVDSAKLIAVISEAIGVPDFH